MAGYIKKVAVIKQVKGGFSADGGALSGLVKAEAYAGFLKAEVSLINFAPLSEGRYVFGISDGEHFITFESEVFECETPFNLSKGFAAIICFCHGGAFPVASAVCGECAYSLPQLKAKIAELEVAPVKGKESAYNDDAIAEENYYELEAYAGGQPVCENKEKEKAGQQRSENEAHLRLSQKTGGVKVESVVSESVKNSNKSGVKSGPDRIRGFTFPTLPSGDSTGAINLASGDFYSRMKRKIEAIFDFYPPEKSLEKVVEGSRWARIDYGKGKHYAFGVLYDGAEATYICYGVPSENTQEPPNSLKGRASYIPVESGGYWVMYQDAKTGVSVKISVG